MPADEPRPPVSLTVSPTEPRIAHVLLDAPERLNALTLATLDGLVDAAARIRRDHRIRAVVLSGAGRSFSSGLDISATRQRPAAVAAAFVPRPWRGTNTFQEAAWAWRRLPVPVIAALHGHVYGGGLQIALAADLRYATPDVRLSVMESRWGLVPDMSGIRTLTEIVGLDQAKRLTFSAEEVSGTEALTLGLVTAVHEDPLAAATATAAGFAERPRQTLAAGKRLLNRAGTTGTRRLLGAERREQLTMLRRLVSR